MSSFKILDPSFLKLSPERLDYVLVGVSTLFGYLISVDVNQKKDTDDRVTDEGYNSLLNAVGTGLPALIVPVTVLGDLYLTPSSSSSTHPLSPGTNFRTLRLIGYGTFIGGSLLRYWSMRTLGKYFTFHLTVRKNHRVIRAGPYGVVRNPSYTGAIISVLGFFMVLGTGSTARSRLGISDSNVIWSAVGSGVLGAAALTRAITRIRIANEEKMLAENFGDDWKRYTKEVPYRLFPFLY